MQSIDETGREHRAMIARLAADAFREHRLNPSSVTATRWNQPMTWTCRREGTGIYGFAVHFEPYMIVIWGDIGACVLRVSDPNSLAWFTSISDESYDYFIEKIQALEDDKQQFCYGDAIAVLDEEVEEAMRDAIAEAATEHQRLIGEATRAGDQTPPAAPDPTEFLDDRDRDRLDHVREVREAMGLVADGTAEEQQRAWYEAWGGVGIGCSDVSECLTPTSCALWMWEARKAFARLYRERTFARWIDSWAGLGKAIAHDVGQNIDPAARAAACKESS